MLSCAKADAPLSGSLPSASPQQRSRVERLATRGHQHGQRNTINHEKGDANCQSDRAQVNSCGSSDARSLQLGPNDSIGSGGLFRSVGTHPDARRPSWLDRTMNIREQEPFPVDRVLVFRPFIRKTRHLNTNEFVNWTRSSMAVQGR